MRRERAGPVSKGEDKEVSGAARGKKEEGVRREGGATVIQAHARGKAARNELKRLRSDHDQALLALLP